MSDYTIDVSPLCIEYGELVRGDDSRTTPADLVAWLRARRVAAAVRSDGGDSIIFAVAHHPEGAVQVVSADGSLADGMTLDELGEELNASGLGIDVALSCNHLPEEDGADHEPEAEDEDEDELDVPEDLGQGTIYALTEGGFVAVDDAEWPEEPTYHVWQFSHRGLGWAEAEVLVNRHPITAASLGGWSAFGYQEPARARIGLPPSRNELPMITLHLIDGEPPEGYVVGWVEVTTRTRREFGGCCLALEPATETTFPEATAEDTDRLLRRLANESLAPDSSTNELLADDTIAVDAAPLHQAMAPSGDDPRRRLAVVVRALGVPPELVALAADGASVPNQRLIQPCSRFAHLVELADGGLADLAPLNREHTAAERAGEWLRVDPRRGLALALAEAGLGALWLGLGIRGHGAKRAVGIGGGLLMLSDGVIDAALAVRRARRQGKP